MHFLLFPTCHDPAIFVRSACFESYPFESNPFSASRTISLKSKCEPMPLVLWWLRSPQAQAQMAPSGFQGLGWSGLVFSPVFSPRDPAESNLKWFVMLRRHLQLSAHATSYPRTLNLHPSGFRALLASDLFWVYPQWTLSVSSKRRRQACWLFWQGTWSTMVLKKCFMNDQHCWCITIWPRNRLLWVCLWSFAFLLHSSSWAIHHVWAQSVWVLCFYSVSGKTIQGKCHLLHEALLVFCTPARG